MRIRPFVTDDWQAVGDIHDRCKPDEMRGVVEPSAIVPFANDSHTQELYGRSSFTVAEDDGTLVGFVATIDAYVSALCVDAPYRGRGVGTALIQSVLDRIEGPVCLNVGRHNVTAIRLYQRLGFTTDVEFVGQFNGLDVECLRLRRAATGSEPADPVNAVKLVQRQWATERGIPFDADGYCETVDANLFGGLSAPARRDYLAGDGAELDVDGGRGKMQALHSSSALACNWFDFWRGRNLESLSRGFGVSSPLIELVGLEQKRSTGMGGIGPNLDVLLRCVDGALVGIESKFTEPYISSPLKTFIKPAYFRSGEATERARWTDGGLPGCQRVANDLRTRTHRFKTLDVAQLLKHMLALSRCGAPWTLCYVWYDTRGPLAEQHRSEVTEFIRRLEGEANHFIALTYRELFFRMLPHVSDDARGYVSYVRERYVDWTA